MEAGSTFSSGTGPEAQGDLWYVDNYILLKDYYDRTISRIAARCVRQGNIAMEEYAHYGYILDVLEEISETGDYIMEHHDLYPYVDKKIAGGVKALEKSLNEFKTELKNNASPEMIKQDKDELDKMKEALGDIDKSVDPTVGAGMSMDQVIEKLMKGQGTGTPAQAGAAPQAQGQRPQGGQPQNQQRPVQSNNAQPRPQQPNSQQQPKPQHPAQGQVQGHQAHNTHLQGQRPQGGQPQNQQRPAQADNAQPRPRQPNSQQQPKPQHPAQGQAQSATKPQPNNPAVGNPPHKGSN